MNMQTTMKSCLIPLLSTVLLLPGCMDLEVGNLNNLDYDEFQGELNETRIAEVSIGLLIGNRAGKAAGNGLVSIVGVLGRESYNLDPNDPRYRTELLEVEELDPGNAAFGGNFWVGPYGNIRQAHILLRALDQEVAGMDDFEKEAVRGFAKTILALEFMTLVTTHWESGVAIDVDSEVNEEIASAPPAPLEQRDAVFSHIATLLDEAQAHLEAAGSATFPFALPGFGNFGTLQGFLQFNRAIKARTSAYAQDWNAVLSALDESFIALDRDALDQGVYYVYSTGAGDVPNGLSNPNLYVHPSVEPLAELQPDGSVDARVAHKLKPNEDGLYTIPSGDLTYSSDQRFAQYFKQPEAPLPLIRNEELILLRAEANIGQGQYEAALPDINFIRVNSGGLAPIDALDASNAIDQLLQQRFYSLLFEGGHRWIDMRRYDRLQDLLTYDENEGLSVHSTFPIPLAEQNARAE
jgi:starch-binding outer membrane protein, SusD/RagB family